MATPATHPKRRSNPTKIVELDLPLADFIEASPELARPASLDTSVSPRLRRYSSRTTHTNKNKKEDAVPVTPSLEIRHPLLTFINDITGSLSASSERFLRPLPQFGLKADTREAIDISSLLQSLEAGEKRLALLSHNKPSLDALMNVSRHIAHQAEYMVRSLRRGLITSSIDPAHPGEDQAASLFESIDNLRFQLEELKLNFEDIATKLFLETQMSIPRSKRS